MFVTFDGLYEFSRNPFGLTNAPATFQRALDIVLSCYTWRTCLFYIDDVIIFSRNVVDHTMNVDEVLHALRSAGITLNLNKCEFFSHSATHLGHVVRPGELAVAEASTRSMRRAAHPTTLTERLSFLGLANVYRRFVWNFAGIDASLYDLMKAARQDNKATLPPLSEEQSKAYDDLRKAVCSPPVLTLPRSGFDLSLDTDACIHLVGCALFQDQPNGSRIFIGYWSRTLTKAEYNYSMTEKKCLALV